MSNINQNNFNNCMNLQLSNSDYWDLFICNDCGHPKKPFESFKENISSCLWVAVILHNTNHTANAFNRKLRKVKIICSLNFFGL